MQIFRFDELDSTMTKARDMLQSGLVHDVFSVSAKRQTCGRGSRGRSWLSPMMNAYMTFCVPRNKISYQMTLLPLCVGTAIAQEIQDRLSPELRDKVNVKWPNDVLVERQKIAGILIECDYDYFLIGMGINVGDAPEIPQDGPDFGRASTCLANVGVEVTELVVDEIISSIHNRLLTKINSDVSSEFIISQWSFLVDWNSPLRIRDESITVRPIRVNTDGSLKVEEESGLQRDLYAEYLY